jgi:hypothetical protein
MKTIIFLLPFLSILQGCLYFNDRGVSGHLYDNCHSYYDENGNFIETCDENIIDYDEAREGVVALKDEIKEDLNNFKDKVSDNLSSINSKIHGEQKGIEVKELTQEEKYQLLQNTTQTVIKEEIEPKQCPCE